MRVLLSILLTVVPWSGLAHAEPRSAASAPAEGVEPAGYRALVHQALREYESRNYHEARVLFAKAHAAFPNARTLRGLGMVEYELQNYGASVDLLREALLSTARPLRGELRRQTEDLLKRTEAFVSVAQLVIEPSWASGYVVQVDGQEVKRAADGGIQLSVGVHELVVTAPGFEVEHRNLDIRGPEPFQILVRLRAPPVDVQPRASAPLRADQSANRSVWRSPWLWTGVGAVVVTSVVTAILLSGKRDTQTGAPIAGDIGGVVQTLGGAR